MVKEAVIKKLITKTRYSKRELVCDFKGGKTMKNVIIFVVSIIVLAILAPATPAAPTIYKNTYKYPLSELDSKETSKFNATREVTRLLLEELVTYIEIYTMVKDFDLTHEEIVTYTGGMVNVEIVKETREGTEYELTAKIEASPEDIAMKIAAIKGERNTRKELAALKQKFEKITKENIQLRESNKKDEATESKYTDNVNIGVALTTVNEVWKLFQEGKYAVALEKIDNAIKIYPTYSYAHILRGRTLGMLGYSEEEVLKVFEVAARLEPEPTRGFVYYQLGIFYNFRPQSNFKDIRISPRESYKDYQKAVDNFKKARDLETTKNGIAYINYFIGVSLYNVGSCWNNGTSVPRNYANAFKWFNESAKYNNKDAQYELGFFYIKPDMGQNEEDRIVQPSSAKAYMWFNLAAAQGHTRANMQRYIVSLDMNSKEITEAQRLSLLLISENE